MDKLINEPSEVYSQSEFDFLPYLNQYNRELFYRTNSQDLYYKLSDSIQSRNEKSHQNDPRFVIHVPFSQKEHESVLKYLLLTKYYNLHDPIHSQPFQIMRALNKTDEKGELVHRSSESIIQYLSEIYIQQSTLFNADDKTIFLTSKLHSFPKKEVNNQFQLAEQIKQIGMNSERSKLIKIQEILPTAAIIFITDVSPIVIDLSIGLKNKSTSQQSQYEACFLMSSSSRFLITGNPEFCSDYHRFCCFYEHGTLNFIDLKHRVKFKNKSTHIPSFKCFPYPCYEALYKLCACSDLEDDGNMLIAAVTDSGTISAWVFHWADRTVSRSSYDPRESQNSRPTKLEWIQGQRLVVVMDNKDIKVISFPWEGKEVEPEIFTMNVPHHFVECQGDAYVLEEEILGPNPFPTASTHGGNSNNDDDNSNQEITAGRSEFSSSSNASDNEEQSSSFPNFTNSKNSIVLGQNHRVHVFAYNGDQFEVEIEQQIISCAYVSNNLALATDKGEIFIFDKNVRYARTRISDNSGISSIVPVKFCRPMFARVTKTNVKFFDNHGNTSIENSFIDPKSLNENSQKIDSFFSRNGFSVSITNKFEIGIKWFY